jgi:hypothetical protein
MRFFRYLWLKVLYWVIAEIILNLIGFDDLADYSEFILHKRVIFSEVTIVEQNNNTNCLIHSIPTLPTSTLNQLIVPKI